MILIVGGGLSGCVLAYRLSLIQDPPPFLLLESKPELCGNHTWSFHQSDLSEGNFKWIHPLISKTWNQQTVRFPDYQRNFRQPYHSIVSQDLAKKIQQALGDRVRFNVKVKSLSQRSVTLANGETLNAKTIIDARGISPELLTRCGYQKFVGIDVELDQPHTLENPIIMDATCEQRDGYRFFYVLPWSPTHLLIEDTRYSDTSDIDQSEYESEIVQFCTSRGWKIKSILRTESAALPVPFVSEDRPTSLSGPIAIGLRGNFFHLTTGYSLADSVKTAELIAREISGQLDWNSETIRTTLQEQHSKIQKQGQYFGLLNRMLFRAAQPHERWKIFSRFYKLPEELIFRFYSGNLTKRDQFRILMGKPPVPLLRAIQQINPRELQ